MTLSHTPPPILVASTNRKMAQGRVSEDATGRMSLVERVNWMYFEMLVRIYIFVRRLVTYFSQVRTALDGTIV